MPSRLGNGLDPDHNLYWGAAAGVRTFFSHSSEWKLLTRGRNSKPQVLERCIFRHNAGHVYLIADAYRGSEIRQTILDFLDAAAGAASESISLPDGMSVRTRGGSNLVAYIGHDGLMDFGLPLLPSRRTRLIATRSSLLAPASSILPVRRIPPERTRGCGRPASWRRRAYTLKAALDGWIANEDGEKIRDRAAVAYDKYQHCGIRAAHRLFASGW